MVKYHTGKIKPHLPWFSPLPWGIFYPCRYRPYPPGSRFIAECGG